VYPFNEAPYGPNLQGLLTASEDEFYSLNHPPYWVSLNSTDTEKRKLFVTTIGGKKAVANELDDLKSADCGMQNFPHSSRTYYIRYESNEKVSFYRIGLNYRTD